MPGALKIDWEQAKLLRAQGLEWHEISEITGVKPSTLTVRASREGWASQISGAKAALKEAVAVKAAMTLEERAARFVEAMADDVVEATAALRDLPQPGSVRGLKEREEAAGLVLKRGRLALGLDRDQANTSVNVFIGQTGAPLVERPAVDVESEKLESP